MVLKDLNVGHEAKCTCSYCRGQGIFSSDYYDGYGFICTFCNGKGYHTIPINDQSLLVQDEKNGIIYLVKNGMIDKQVTLFQERVLREDVKYVMYAPEGFSSFQKDMKKTSQKGSVISYEDFLKGKKPLPSIKYDCPQHFLEYFDVGRFNDCYYGMGCHIHCPKFGTTECWDIFYGDAKTTEEKQKVINKRLGTKKPFVTR